MSTGFNWFRKYEIKITDEIFYREVNLKYLDGGSTSHSGGNIGKVQDLIENYSGKRIPTICEDFIQSEDENLNLIEPMEMYCICEEILNGKKLMKLT